LATKWFISQTKNLAGVPGFEPGPTVLETVMLPLTPHPQAPPQGGIFKDSYFFISL
jgi:hypothetical protein